MALLRGRASGGAGETGLGTIDWLICAYLTLPLLLFCAWFTPPVAVVMALASAYALHVPFKGVGGASRTDLGPRMLAAIGLIALIWTALAGVGHFVYANTDWQTRDAVLRDLVATRWPPRYEGDGDWPVILRAPVGYYLPSAALGSVLGQHAASLSLYAWTAIGFALFLAAAASLFDSARQRWICLVVLIAFGGMDLPGYILDNGRLPALGQHIEAWAGYVQYSSNSTLLFWVPNHALPAWLGSVLLLRHWRTPALARLAPLMAAAIPLWSPLAAIGLAPFFAAGLDWRRDGRRVLSIRESWPVLAVAFIVARYLTMDSVRIPSAWTMWRFPEVSDFLVFYVKFCGLEFGLLALVLGGLRRYDVSLGVAVLVLLVLPFYQFGPSNDLAMRSSIPALTVLALATVVPLADRGASVWRYALLLILGVGALGAAQEPLRAVLRPRWLPTGETLGELSSPHQPSYAGWLPPHYVAQLNQPGLAMLMREPTMVLPDAAASGAAR
jgi:hypothetical protein